MVVDNYLPVVSSVTLLSPPKIDLLFLLMRRLVTCLITYPLAHPLAHPTRLPHSPTPLNQPIYPPHSTSPLTQPTQPATRPPHSTIPLNHPTHLSHTHSTNQRHSFTPITHLSIYQAILHYTHVEEVTVIKIEVLRIYT